jgi:hypothetical protein
MILEHIAAILVFSGPLFYIGLWMALDPAGIAWVPELIVRVFRNAVKGSGGPASEGILEPEQTAISHRLRRALRFAGVALLLIAVAV